MNKYNIKVGDYVETWDGGIGYVTSVDYDSFKWMIVKPRNISSAMDAGESTTASFSSIKNIYKRIGENEFGSNGEFNPIKLADELSVAKPVQDKINELIYHIIAIQERINEYDSTRTN